MLRRIGSQADVEGQGVARTLGGAADTASPQIVRKKSGRDQEQATTANDDKSAFPEVRATFPARTNHGQLQPDSRAKVPRLQLNFLLR